MNFPSFSRITGESAKTFRKYPLAIISAAVAALAGILLTEMPGSDITPYPVHVKLIFIGALGIPLYYAVAAYSFKNGVSVTGRYLLAGGVFILQLMYFLLSGDSLAAGPGEAWYRFALYFLAAHLLVSAAPFAGGASVPAFWEYNKSLFLRFLTAVLYSVALYVGLIVAMLSVDQLLGIDISGERYVQLISLIAGLFNTWFFLAGVPDLSREMELEPDYPGALKLFVQYVLIPLVTVYILILYLYTGKIIWLWELPEGWVANLVLSFSIAGILALLLVYPIRNKEGNRWMQYYSRAYYLALIPLIILLAISIYVRIDTYGVTINRYFVVILSLWLTGITAYFLISSREDIRIIPISLGLSLVLISFGPWGAFSVSENSQVNRFISISESQGLMENEVLLPGRENAEISSEMQSELSSVLIYLTEHHGLQSISHLLDEETRQAAQKVQSPWQMAEIIMESAGLEFGISTVTGINEEKYFVVRSEITEGVLLPASTELYAGIELTADNPEIKLPVSQADTLILRYDFEEQRLHRQLSRSGESFTADIEFGAWLKDHFLDEINSLPTGNTLMASPAELRISQPDNSLQTELLFHEIRGTYSESNGFRLRFLEFSVLHSRL